MDKLETNSAVKKYDVAYSKKLGRYLVAAKDLSAGEVILREDPLAVGPAIFETSIFCFACMRPLPGYRVSKTRYACSNCDVAPLCNRACENNVGHHSARECRVFLERKDLYAENIEELVRILLHLRLWLLKDHDRDTWNRLTSMEAHLDKRRNTPVWHDRKTNVVNVFRKFGLTRASEDDEASEDDSESVQRICGVVDVNSFELRSPGGQLVGAAEETHRPLLRGLFVEAALMDHACRATSHVTVDENFRMAVHAAVPHRVGDNVSFNYTSSLLGTIERQEHLLEGKYFHCECSACKDPLEGGSYLSCILCPRCKKNYVAIQKLHGKEPYGRNSKWQCQKCKRLFAGCLIKSTIDIGKNLISQVEDDNCKAMENLLEKLSRTFHKNHFLMLSLKQKVLAIYRQEMTTVNPQRKILQKMLELGKEVLDVLEIVEPGISRLKGIMLYELHLPLSVLANRAYAAREIGARELCDRLEEAQTHLRRSLTMLLLEPASTPEGLLARQALQEMKLLTLSIEDAKALLAPVQPGCNERERRQTTRDRSRGKNRRRVK